MSDFIVDKSSPIPYYFQIEEWIRGLITSGQLKPGDMLENEISLGERLGVSRITVRQALSNLTTEGLLVRHRAKGTFVAPPRALMPFEREQLMSVTEEVASEGHLLHSRVLAHELVTASGEVLRELKLKGGDKVVHIHRLRSVDSGPISIESAYHPFQRFPALLEMDLTDQSIYELLEKRYDARPIEATDTFIASIANREEAQLLDICEGDPVMRYRRTARDSNNQPVEFMRAIYRADHYQFVIHYHHGKGQLEKN
jgi:GntR family transcriptional regulator